MPGVSISMTGPKGRSSIVLYTGSVVVPLTSETMARFCPVTAFMMLDFPAFRLPKKEMCTRSAAGVWFIDIVASFWFSNVCIITNEYLFV